jgi:TRAP-type mannitol/chloroaromatic compound transport system permease large subunit
MIAFLTHNLAPIMFGSLILFLLLGYPVAFSLAALGIGYWLVGMELGIMPAELFQALPERLLGSVMANETLLAIPFFTFMGLVLERSGMAEKLLDTVGKLFGPMRGGVAYAVIFVGALLAATTGVVAASVIAMGLISLPIMLRYGYDRRLATGVIAASGTLAQIIPPSLVLIVLADQLGKSVGDMYLGAFVPGFILTGLYALYVLVITILFPSAAPALPPEARSFGEGAPYAQVVKAVVLPVTLVILAMTILFDPDTADVVIHRYLPFITGFIQAEGLVEPYASLVKLAGIVVVYYVYVFLIAVLPRTLARIFGFAALWAAAWILWFILHESGVARGTPAEILARLNPIAYFGQAKSFSDGVEMAIAMNLPLTRLWADWFAFWAALMSGIGFFVSPSPAISRAVRRIVADLLPPLILVFLVLGTIFRGIATPTEGGAMGAAGAVILALINGKLNFSLLKQSGEATARLSAFVVFILIGARVFSLTFYGVNGHVWVEEIMRATPGGMYGFLIIVMLIVFFLAFFLDFFELAFIAVPLLVKPAEAIFMSDPAAVAIAQTMGFAVADGKVVDVAPFVIWFGVLLGVNMQTSFMHPPFGFALFYLRSVAPTKPYNDPVTGKLTPPVTTGQIYWGAVPFVVIQVVMIGIVLAFPKTVMWYNSTASLVDPSKVEINLGAPPGSGLSMPGMPGLGLPGLTGPDLGAPPALPGGPAPDLSQPPAIDLSQPPKL